MRPRYVVPVRMQRRRQAVRHSAIRQCFGVLVGVAVLALTLTAVFVPEPQREPAAIVAALFGFVGALGVRFGAPAYAAWNRRHRG